MDFFPWVKRITISYNVFLYPSHLPVLPQRLLSWEILRSDVIHWVRLLRAVSGLNWCSAFQGEDWTGAPAGHCVSKAIAGECGYGGDCVGLGPLQSCLWISVPWAPDQHLKWLKLLMQNILRIVRDQILQSFSGSFRVLTAEDYSK